MSGFVYIWYDLQNKRFYIGSHWGSSDDGYVCSSSWMKKAYKRHPHTFKRRIIATISTNREDLLTEERRWLAMIPSDQLGKRYYNLRIFTAHWYTDDHRRKTIGQKISEATTTAMARPEVREKYLNGLKTRNTIQSPESLAKRGEAIRQNWAIRSPVELREKIMEFGSSEYNDFMRDHTTKMWADRTPESRKELGQKISAANLKRHADKHPGETPEQRDARRFRQRAEARQRYRDKRVNTETSIS